MIIVSSSTPATCIAVIILSKADKVKKEELQDVKIILQDLNPLARFQVSRDGDLPLDAFFNTGLFSFDKAALHNQW